MGGLLMSFQDLSRRDAYPLISRNGPLVLILLLPVGDGPDVDFLGFLYLIAVKMQRVPHLSCLQTLMSYKIARKRRNNHAGNGRSQKRHAYIDNSKLC